LQDNTTITCADVDSGENRGDCCYTNQYSDGQKCVSCEVGTDCTVLGTSLATQALTAGYWRASSTSTDVRPCWFVDACAGNSDASRSSTIVSQNCSATAYPSSLSGDTTSSSVSADNILVEDSLGCNDTAITTRTASIGQIDVATYCASGYKGPCKLYYCSQCSC
jgi:hypothetical protein